MHPLDLLTGDAQNFRDKVWASHVHVHHTDPDALQRLLSVADVDHLLTSTALRAPALRIAKDGSVLPTAAFTRPASLAGQPLTGLVDAGKVLALFDDGASLVLQGLHRYWPPLTELVGSLEHELGHPCQANAYLTPAGSQGFARHSDSHDVFVFQTHGTKLWEVDDGEGVREVRLEPGVSMYLPTGTPHAARAQDTASLHVTVGINRLTWRSLLRQVVDDALEEQGYDAPLPAGYLDDPTVLRDGIGERLQGLGAALARTAPDDAAAQQVRRFLTGRSPDLAGGLTDRLRLAEIDDHTVLRRRPGSTCVLAPTGDRLRVLLGDRALRVPARLLEPIQEIRDRDTLRPADLARWLDPQSRLVLCRRLVREGLLRVDG